MDFKKIMLTGSVAAVLAATGCSSNVPYDHNGDVSARRLSNSINRTYNGVDYNTYGFGYDTDYDSLMNRGNYRHSLNDYNHHRNYTNRIYNDNISAIPNINSSRAMEYQGTVDRTNRSDSMTGNTANKLTTRINNTVKDVAENIETRTGANTHQQTTGMKNNTDETTAKKDVKSETAKQKKPAKTAQKAATNTAVDNKTASTPEVKTNTATNKNTTAKNLTTTGNTVVKNNNTDNGTTAKRSAINDNTAVKNSSASKSNVNDYQVKYLNNADSSHSTATGKYINGVRVTDQTKPHMSNARANSDAISRTDNSDDSVANRTYDDNDSHAYNDSNYNDNSSNGNDTADRSRDNQLATEDRNNADNGRFSSNGTSVNYDVNGNGKYHIASDSTGETVNNKVNNNNSTPEKPQVNKVNETANAQISNMEVVY